MDAQVLSDAGVSTREADVLSGVAEHLTNAEIAAHLYISVRTVESHVSSLLRKLGVADRRALASYAVALTTDEHAGSEGAGPPAASTLPVARPLAPAIPTPLTSFVGRATEREALGAAIAGHRLVTAVGPGGVGKTRLAIAVAAETVESADAVWFVDLVPISDPGMVAAAVAAVLGVAERPGGTIDDAVLARLGRSEALIVLDNCEHLVDGVAVFVERLLATCPQTRVLATSRTRLMLPFEHVFPVPGLSLQPDEGEDSDAVALFLERARAAAGFEPGPGDVPRIASVCRSLDGMALAIELAAAQVAGFPPIDSGLADGLARLADNSLAVARPGSETRYRVLETIRQYGVDRLERAGELEEVRARQLRWCVATAAELVERADKDVERYVQGGGGDGAWRGAFDLVADDLRAGLAWAVGRPELRDDAHRLALLQGSLTFLRGLPAEAQRRFEEAATLSDDPAARVSALNDAAGAAMSRHVGNDSFRLWRQAADIAAASSDGVTAAHNLALAATLINRGPGIMADVPPASVVDDLIQEAVSVAGGSPLAEPSILTAQAFSGDDLDPVTRELAERAVTLAQRVGDAYDESAALDELSAVHLAAGDVPAAVATIRARIEVLERIPLGPATGMEFSDCYAMASEISLAAGDFVTARAYADRLAALPFVTELDHIASARRLKVDAMAGDLDAVVAAAERFRRGWEQAGRPVASNLAGAAMAVAMVHGLRGDEDQRAEWRERSIAIGVTAERLESPLSGYVPTFDAIVHLHVGDVEAAVTRLSVDPDRLRTWFSGEWRPWYAALWAEAAVLAGRDDAAERIERARLSVAANPVATAMVDRAVAFADGDTDRIVAAAAAMEPTGCRYQWARTLVMAGGQHREAGAAALERMGAIPTGMPQQ
jgi:predicted ATPase/DNA-binding CsgD family transcriptional regulator